MVEEEEEDKIDVKFQEGFKLPIRQPDSYLRALTSSELGRFEIRRRLATGYYRPSQPTCLPTCAPVSL